MKFSTSIIVTLAASTALAAPIATDFNSTASASPSASSSVSAPSSSAVVDLDDPVQKSWLSIASKILSGAGVVSTIAGLFGGSNSNSDSNGSSKIKRELESAISISSVPTSTIYETATASDCIYLSDPVQKAIASEISKYVENVKRDLSASVSATAATAATVASSTVSVPASSSSAVTPLTDAQQKSFGSFIKGFFKTVFGLKKRDESSAADPASSASTFSSVPATTTATATTATDAVASSSAPSVSASATPLTDAQQKSFGSFLKGLLKLIF
ncbi:unnamed protein product [Ambrosiozyma monospora]|uniref:Unnamed protein product n=1 Tax=Ambrosiozyma monospora TaxID=43982 RepID=A0ACB5SUA7_AMBMO|nr:unnamed protein product [Ambrosiozyma monospora]